MAGNRGGPGTQADQPDPLGRMSELFAQVLLLLAVSPYTILILALEDTCAHAQNPSGKACHSMLHLCMFMLGCCGVGLETSYPYKDAAKQEPEVHEACMTCQPLYD